jgi:hypothetical protein
VIPDSWSIHERHFRFSGRWNPTLPAGVHATIWRGPILKPVMKSGLIVKAHGRGRKSAPLPRGLVRK